jgi:regulatory LuxR family protein
MVAAGMSSSEIARDLGITKGTVTYHRRRLHLPISEEFGYRYDWDAIRIAYESGLSMRECCRRFGCSRGAWQSAVKRGAIVQRESLIPIEDLLVRGRKTARGHLKRRLVDAGLKENRCEECGITEWQGKPLAMQLHHVNGDPYDNRLENLEFLCANCHSQTETYGGRNGHRRPSALRLVESDAA